MRFDPDRVVALADAWNDPRLAPIEGETRAADTMAGLFEGAGLRVERTEPSVIAASPWRLALALALWLGLTTAFLLTGFSIPARVGLIGLILASLLATAWRVGRLVRAVKQGQGAQQIIGRPIREDRPSARVIVLTRLEASGRTGRERWMVFLWGLLVFQSVVLLGIWLDGRAFTPDTILNLMAGQWLTAFWMVLYPAWRTDRPVTHPHRTGPALLAELARTWPQGVGERVETWFVATPNALALARELANQTDEGPSPLVIDLDSPGVGEQILIAARGPALWLADTAARDLWIPHRTTRKGIGRFVSRFGWLVVGLRGAPADAPINPALLTATAQLVTELALRWARQAAGPDQPESPARSSQKPG